MIRAGKVHHLLRVLLADYEPRELDRLLFGGYRNLQRARKAQRVRLSTGLRVLQTFRVAQTAPMAPLDGKRAVLSADTLRNLGR